MLRGRALTIIYINAKLSQLDLPNIPDRSSSHSTRRASARTYAPLSRRPPSSVRPVWLPPAPGARARDPARSGTGPRTQDPGRARRGGDVLRPTPTPRRAAQAPRPRAPREPRTHRRRGPAWEGAGPDDCHCQGEAGDERKERRAGPLSRTPAPSGSVPEGRREAWRRLPSR